MTDIKMNWRFIEKLGNYNIVGLFQGSSPSNYSLNEEIPLLKIICICPE